MIECDCNRQRIISSCYNLNNKHHMIIVVLYGGRVYLKLSNYWYTDIIVDYKYLIYIIIISCIGMLTARPRGRMNPMIVLASIV